MEKNWDKLKKERMERISKIKNIILIVSKHGEKASYKKVLAEFCLQEGITKRTCKEYLDLLIDSGQIIQEGDNLFIELPKQKQTNINEDLKILDNSTLLH